MFLYWQTIEPRGAWKILAEFDFNKIPARPSALCADAFFRGEPDFVTLRCVLDKVRIYFEQNPSDES